MKNRQSVHLLRGVRNADPVVLGGKGRSLADMVALGLPVPPGFVITTSVSRAFNQEGRFPKRLDWHLTHGMRQLEKATGKRFGDPRRPLLVSVRSGAPTSMPGMMDTILNLGMTDDVAEGLAQQFGDDFAEDCRSRFFQMFTSVTQPHEDIRLVPENPRVQLEMAIEAVVRSWSNPRAVTYRTANNIPDWHGTAVVVQEMVFGNRDDQSCTGVVFSRNVTTGSRGMYGEFLVNAQGEDVVSGTHAGRPISELLDWNPRIYGELREHAVRLEKVYKAPVDIEFTVESGRLFLLQVRVAKLAPLAAVTVGVHNVWDGVETKADMLARFTRAQLKTLKTASFDESVVSAHESSIVLRGTPVSAGAVTGRVVFSCEAAIRLAATEPVVLVRPDTTPDDLEGMLVAKAIVTNSGGPTCHAALVARELGIAAVVGCSDATHQLSEGELVTVDGLRGLVFRGALPEASDVNIKEVHLFTKWAEQFRPELLRTPPQIDWTSVERCACVNEILADFYLTDAMAKEANGTPLATEAIALREQVHLSAAHLFACYLTIAVWGELRYVYNSSYDVLQNPDLKEQLIEALVTTFGFMDSNERSMGMRGHERAVYQFSSAPVSRVADFLSLAVRTFDELHWDKGMGGHAWAQIAMTVRDYLKGTIEHSIFVDHVFDLRHNGGRLFDKHSMVSTNTLENTIKDQLVLKKDAQGVIALHFAMESAAPARRFNKRSTFSAAVDALYFKGLSQRLWNT